MKLQVKLCKYKCMIAKSFRRRVLCHQIISANFNTVQRPGAFTSTLLLLVSVGF